MDNNTIENYEPYGAEWEKEIRKVPKKFIIDMVRNKAKENEALRISNDAEVKELRAEIEMLKEQSKHWRKQNSEQMDKVEELKTLVTAGVNSGAELIEQNMKLESEISELKSKLSLQPVNEPYIDKCDCENEMMCSKNCPGRNQE